MLADTGLTALLQPTLYASLCSHTCTGLTDQPMLLPAPRPELVSFSTQASPRLLQLPDVAELEVAREQADLRRQALAANKSKRHSDQVTITKVPSNTQILPVDEDDAGQLVRVSPGQQNLPGCTVHQEP